MSEEKSNSQNSPAPIELNLKAVIDGEIISIEKVSDPIFSMKIMGDGYAIFPSGKKLYSPVSGKVKEIANTKHAVYLSTENQLKILIHIGIDTIELKGDGFKTNIENGMLINKGDLLVSFDPEYIQEKGYDPMISVVLLNQKEKEIDLTILPNPKATANETLALEAKIYPKK